MENSRRARQSHVGGPLFLCPLWRIQEQNQLHRQSGLEPVFLLQLMLRDTTPFFRQLPKSSRHGLRKSDQSLPHGK